VRRELQALKDKQERLEGESKVLVEDITKLEADTGSEMNEEEAIPAEDSMDNVDWS